VLKNDNYHLHYTYDIFTFVKVRFIVLKEKRNKTVSSILVLPLHYSDVNPHVRLPVPPVNFFNLVPHQPSILYPS
jgi:hypothetical protein